LYDQENDQYHCSAGQRDLCWRCRVTHCGSATSGGVLVDSLVAVTEVQLASTSLWHAHPVNQGTVDHGLPDQDVALLRASEPRTTAIVRHARERRLVVNASPFPFRFCER